MKPLNMRSIMAVFAALAVFSACQSDSYETGQGQSSLIQADFVEAHTSALSVIDRVETDDNQTFSLSQPHNASWATVADTVYRALLYYEKTDASSGQTGASSSQTGASVVRVVSVSQVPMLHPTPLKAEETLRTDPVKFESLWVSANGKYLNLGLYLKNGSTQDGSQRHTLGMIRESEATSADGKRTVFLRLYHDQGGVPEYYSSRYYLSVPCKEIDADTVVVAINSYDGAVERRFSLTNR